MAWADLSAELPKSPPMARNVSFTSAGGKLYAYGGFADAGVRPLTTQRLLTQHPCIAHKIQVVTCFEQHQSGRSDGQKFLG
jgi:hypothetical protein